MVYKSKLPDGASYRSPSGSKFTLIEQIYKECGKRLDPGKEHQVDNKQDVERYCFFDECRGLTLCIRVPIGGDNAPMALLKM